MVAGDQFTAREDVAFHGVIQLRAGCARGQIQLCIQREQHEHVMVVGVARARSAVADLVEVVLALQGAVGQLGLCGERRGQGARPGRQVEEQPVHKSLGQVTIVENQREAPGAVGRRVPSESGRGVDSVAGERCREATVGKAIADELKRIGALPLDGRTLMAATRKTGDCHQKGCSEDGQ